MKYIQKQEEPSSLKEWKQQANENWQPTYETLGSKLKDAIKEALMKEQGYLCCYCEQRVTLNTNNSHIEHFRPQNDPTVDPLDFSNMLCSCQNQLKKGEPRHCGNLKGKWFDENHLISPLDPDCETRFKFTGDGYIQPRKEEDNAALITIEKLGLDIPKLRALRRDVIEPFLDETLSIEDVQRFVNGYLSPSNDGKFGEFWTTIYYLYREYIDAD
ncbi:MAG: TIGR02646 family protein [Crocosphaera sp.]|nr:TIGR02646 family protein [Crocosphaera sp.]